MSAARSSDVLLMGLCLLVIGAAGLLGMPREFFVGVGVGLMIAGLVDLAAGGRSG